MVLPFPDVTDQDRLVRVSVSENCGRPDCWRRMSSPDDYRALQEGLPSVEGLAAYSSGDVSAGVPDARLLRAIAASANYFDVLGVRPRSADVRHGRCRHRRSGRGHRPCRVGP